MGNKQGKPTKASAPSPSRSKTSSEDASVTQQAPPPQPPQPAAPSPAPAAPAFVAPPPPPAQQQQQQQQQPRPPRAPAAARSLLETKLAHVDVATVFTTQEILSIRKHLAAVLGLAENDAIVIPKDEFFRFLVGNSASSLYVNRLYAIFDMDKKGYVRLP